MIIREATPDDAQGMSEMLNEIIEVGGTTAFLTPVTAETIQSWMTCDPEKSSWHVAVDEDGQIAGYQSAEPYDSPAKDALTIATFVRIGVIKSGIGSRMFEATIRRARDLGYRWINATIRSDNTGGRAYYRSRGFQTWKEDGEATLTDGRTVGKVSKRYDL